MNLREQLVISAGGPGSGCKGPNCGRPRIHPFDEGDTVILKTDRMRGNKKTRAGSEGTIIKVLPMQLAHETSQGAEPGQVQYYAVRLPNGHIEYMTHDELASKPSGFKPQPPPQPMSGKMVKQSLITGDKQARFTAFYPTKEKSDDPRKLGTGRVAGFGKFEQELSQTHGVIPGQILDTYRYNKPGEKEGQGMDVLVYRQPGTKWGMVQEIKTGEYRWMHTQMKQFEFKNLGKMAGFLTRRYGISMKLPKGR